MGRGKDLIRIGGVLLALPVIALADAATYDIPVQPLPTALKAFAAQADMQLFYVFSDVEKGQGNLVRGDLDDHTALKQLLRNTGLEAIYTSATEATIRPIRVQASLSDQQSDSTGGIRAQARSSGPGASATAGDASGVAQGADRLEEVIVTTQKREERLQDVPVPVTAITATALADRNEFRIQDYYTQVPGLQLTPNQLGGASTISIRGITTGDFSNPTVAITVDDVPFGSSTVLGGGFLVPDLDPTDLARIEVLRGPQGTLYGASSIGGLVKYVTANPSTDQLSGRVQAGLAAVHAGSDVGYNVSGAVNIPLGDTLAMRASGFTRRDPGYIDNIQSGERDVNRTDVQGGHLSVLWRPSNLFSLKINALAQDNRIAGSPFVTIAPGVGDLQQRFLPGTGYTDRKFYAFSAVATAKLGPLDVTSVTGYNRTQLRDSYDYTEGVGPLTALVFPPPQGFTNNIDATRTTKFTQEIRFSMPIGSHVDWLFGGFYAHEYTPWVEDYLATDAGGATIGDFANFSFWSKYTDVAGFTNLTLHLTDRFDVQVGGRESSIRQTFGEVDTGPFVSLFETPDGSPVLVYPEFSVKESAFTYLFTPQFKISRDLMVYARLASGYRPGGINSSVIASASAALAASPSFKPDKTQNYELGVKANVLDHMLYLDASVYYIKWKDIQLQLINPVNSLAYFSNGSAAKSEGVELSAQTAPLAGFRLGGWVSWNEAVLTQALPSNSLVGGNEGDRLPFSSRFSASATLDYEFPLGRFTGSVGGDVSFVGERFGGFVPRGTPRQSLPGYTKMDLRAGMKMNGWDVDLYLNNVTDRRGLLGGGLGTIIPDAYELVQPRTVGLAVARRF